MTYIRRTNPRRRSLTLGLATVAALIGLPSNALAASSGGIDPSGTTTATVPGSVAQLVDGKAIPPADAPARVIRAINAANRIEEMPYDYGGGHAGWLDDGYDCSGAVSFALGKPGARTITAPMASGSFMKWGKPGPGEWITTYANKGHMYAVIAGLRWDTANTPGDGPGWATTGIASAGYTIRHPPGL